jgi:glycerol-3-phosphate dehydrogenase
MEIQSGPVVRSRALASLRAKPDLSVLIIGGGINGAGLFRDLALQGVDVVLVEKGDFCSGASAASSHMIHGGLRYLENGEFGLVRESLHERNRLLRNAPHYVHPLPTTIPLFHRLAGLMNGARTFLRLRGRPANRGAAVVKIGLTLYDLFTGRQRSMPPHHFSSRASALAARPQLNPQIIGTATYYDAWIRTPERLALELLLDGEASGPQARALNYVRATRAEGGEVWLHDTIADQIVAVRPRIVVNASGAWIDHTNRALQHNTQLIGGTKGSHLLIDNPELLAATAGHMLYYENADGRICILFPIGDKVLVGSTDIYIDDPETVRCEEDEVAYMLASIRQIFPAIQLDSSHIRFRYSGVRPLPRSSAASAGQVSRNHRCVITPPGTGLAFPIYSLVGGKWTTFRAFAEQVADQLLHELGRPRLCSTTDRPIGGGQDYPSPTARDAWVRRVAQQHGLPSERVAELFERYGTRAAAVAAFIAAASDTPLDDCPTYSRREVLFLIGAERVYHLDDLLLRRSELALLGKLTPALLNTLAEIAAEALGWTTEQCLAEVDRTTTLLRTNHGVELNLSNRTPALPMTTVS